MTDTPAYLWVVFGVLFGATLIWFGLVSALYRRLASNHQEKYRQMGEPGLIRNNPPGATITLMKFLFAREDRALNDPQVSREATSIHQGRWRADVICRGNERKSTSANCSSEPCVHRMEPANSYDLDLLLAV